MSRFLFPIDRFDFLRAAVSFIFAATLVSGVAKLQLARGDGEKDGQPIVVHETPVRFEFVEPHMGTHFRILLYSQNRQAATQAAAAGFRRIKELDQICSDYKDDSELTRLSQSAGGPGRNISQDLFQVLFTSQKIAHSSHGAFDVTCGPLVQLYRKAKRVRKLPTETQIADAMARVGHSHLVLDERSRHAKLHKANMLLDLGGIAKGYACEAALHEIRKFPIAAAMVEGGGGQAVLGSPPSKSNWEIAVEMPTDPAGTKNGVEKPAPTRSILVKLPNGFSIATSGNASQYFEVDGKRYSHILDPRSGKFLATNRQVTVIDKSGAVADALATAVCVLGPEAGIKLIDDHWQSACLIFEPSGKGYDLITSRKWNDYVVGGVKGGSRGTSPDEKAGRDW